MLLEGLQRAHRWHSSFIHRFKRLSEGAFGGCINHV